MSQRVLLIIVSHLDSVRSESAAHVFCRQKGKYGDEIYPPFSLCKQKVETKIFAKTKLNFNLTR